MSANSLRKPKLAIFKRAFKRTKLKEQNNPYDLSLNELNSLKSSISNTQKNTNKHKFQNFLKSSSKSIKNYDSASNNVNESSLNEQNEDDFNTRINQSYNDQKINSIQKYRNIFFLKTQKLKKKKMVAL